ncbi:RHS repeat domain-containing protein, partial [Streptomyces sp. NPDC056930]|uniref:RHS repeat domain-containing protein n=1 Tax=Streptomyces sp. NPDC056930 TaxID=3345967 RepID=UPI00363355F5
ASTMPKQRNHLDPLDGGRSATPHDPNRNGEVSITDAKGNATTTTYYPAAAGPLTSTVVAAPKLASNGQSHKTYTYVDPARGSVTSTLDANVKKTENSYDALGRITDTWAPNRTKGIDTPTVKYDYNFARGSQPWTSVATIKADGQSYQTSYAITDALLRPLQTQTASPLGGRILTDTRYDSRGLAYETYADIYDNTAAPNGTYARASYAHTPALTRTTYDEAARPTTSTFTVFGDDRWSTTTSYTGDSTATTAVKGGNATRTITDALGRTTETRTYAGTEPNDTAYGATTGTAYTRVKYDYTRDSKQSQITGIDDAKWTYTYDLFGRQTGTTDPDKGASSTEYTDLDQIDFTTDSRNAILLYGYDEIGRKTDLWQTTKTDANKLAHWSYDTLLKGKPTASTRYVGGTTGKAYTKQITAYDTLGRATSTDVLLPADDSLVISGAVKDKITFGTDYRLDGAVNNTKEPGIAGLPTEIVEPKYNSVGLTTELSGTNTYLLGVTYSALGQAEQLTLGAGAKNTYITNKYEAGTGRLTRSHVTDQTHPYMLQDLNFAQDDAGNVQSISDPTTLGGTTKADNQCFEYDANRRLTEAWTPKTADCATSGRTTANLDGAAPYWTSYTYNNAGQRDTETTHAATGDATTTYGYKTPTGQPHPLVKTTGAKAATYKYDDAGNTTGRPGTQATQTLDWNTEGELASTTEPAAGTKPALGTTYLYDADGELLIRRAAGDGDTVLYLGATEVRLTTKGATKTVSGTRYYSAAGQTIAVRTATAGVAGSKLSFLAADHHGTSSIATDATTQDITKRYTTPFGAPRGTKSTTWPDDKAFLGKPADTTTGLTHIGAREYDPSVGQFISVDPVLALDQHQSLNGYAYANNTPVTSADPTGMWIDDGTGHSEPRPDGPAGPPSPTPGRTGGTASGSTRSPAPIQPSSPSGLSPAGQKAWGEALAAVASHKAFFANGADTAEGLDAMSQVFWDTFCKKAEDECPAERPVAESVGDFGLHLYDTGLGNKLEAMGSVAVVGGMSAAQAMKNIMDPEHVRGQSEKYLIALAEKAGFSTAPMKPTAATGGRGTRVYMPSDPDVMIFLEAGDPNNTSSDKVHQGPYVKYQIRGAGKAGAFRVPIEGNPHPTLGGRWSSNSMARILDFMARMRA